MTALEQPESVTSENERAPELPDFGPEQLIDRVGIKITEYTPDRVVGTLPITGNRQPYGLLHGGASAVLAETLGSLAAALHAGPERIAVGVDLSCTHHRPVTDGHVIGVATPLHRGRGTATYDIAISNETGKRVCSARLTCVLREQTVD